MASLYYVIGPSGAGKDSLLGYARARIPDGARLLFAHRYITRPADAGGENHVALSPGEFAARRDAGLFCLCWESHGLGYGIGVEVVDWLSRGFAVVVNGSREYLPEAARRIDSIVPVLVTVRAEVLRQRLIDRGRETPAQIEERLRRASACEVDHPRLLTIPNNGTLEDAGERFLGAVLHGAEAEPAASAARGSPDDSATAMGRMHDRVTTSFRSGNVHPL